MRAHPLSEARALADLMLVELRKVIPAFLTRVDRPERDGAWSRIEDSTWNRLTGVQVRVVPGGSAL